MTKRSSNIATAILVCFALVIGGRRVFQFLDASSEPVEYSVVEDARRFATVGHRVGPLDADVTIVEFFDYDCPICKRAALDLRTLRDLYPNEIAIVYRYLPARSTKSFTKYRASECAGRIGHFASIHEAIYAHSDSSYTWKWHDWLDELEVGERMNQFRTCMADTSGLSAIHRDTMDANELGLIGTPSYLINGLLIEGHPGFNKFVELIRVAGQSK